jgi:triosephosphate isomerase (TIM)
MAKLIAGNWKMYKTPSEAKTWFQDLVKELPSTANAALMVPFTALPYAAEILEGYAAWGAQDVSVHVEGAYTGEISAKMLADLGCSYCLVGHSERRTYHGESDSLVAQKALRLQEVGITPIVCVGEPLEVREAGKQVKYTLEQLAKSTQGLDRFVVAYEPVWAIGTGKTASSEDANAMHQALKETLPGGTAVLYGGSVNPGNASSLFAESYIDGGLVGGASLKIADYLQLLAAAVG